MKTKYQHKTPHLLSTNYVQKLGLNWQELFNPSLAIHANRELNMSKMKFIGFDMDYTLAIYKKLPMESLQYDLARDYLINEMAYPQELEHLRFDHSLLIRGLVIDKELGNVLKLDDQHYVWRAVHCRQALSDDQIAIHYGTKRIRVGDDRYYSLDTFFSIPEGCLFIDMIECLYQLTKTPLDFKRIFTDIRLAMDTIHSNNTLKKIISANIETFIAKDLEIESSLRRLKLEGKKLFLLTNSNFAYTNTVLKFVFNCQEGGSSWLDIFDLIIVDAQKPDFFTGSKPFICTSSNKVFTGGNINDFHQLCDARGQEILYVGDHIYGDIVRSKKDSMWRTCLIIKELNFDIRTAIEHKHDFKNLQQIHNEQSLADKRLMRLRTLLGMLENRLLNGDETVDGNLHNLIDEVKYEIIHSTRILQRLKDRYFKLNREIEDRFHAQWGRLFKENQELSRFGAQVRQYACIYTDHIKNFLHYGAHHMFFARKEKMSHENDLE